MISQQDIDAAYQRGFTRAIKEAGASTIDAADQPVSAVTKEQPGILSTFARAGRQMGWGNVLRSLFNRPIPGGGKPYKVPTGLSGTLTQSGRDADEIANAFNGR